MSKKGLSLRDLLEPLRERYFISGEINTKVASMDECRGSSRPWRSPYRHGTSYELDGVSVEFPTGTSTCAPSNTEPLLRLNLEAPRRSIMEKRRDEVSRSSVND